MFGNFILVDFEMVRYGTGDVATLNNVSFYSDAAVLMPESKPELDNLLALMDDKSYKIVIHGHTNGNSQGKIITMGPSKNFFALTKDDKQGFGSAKDLSRERAQTIKDWLVANGVSADRIDVKGWGGAKMIYDKNSVNARKNVRVELEIVAN
jgi:outer membrane protein OmpA-like peptidoglycan-associated protein